MSLGGYVAEEMIFGDITTGPSNDLQVATSLARAMVTRWGMSDLIGPVALESDGGRTMFGKGVDEKGIDKKTNKTIIVVNLEFTLWQCSKKESETTTLNLVVCLRQIQRKGTYMIRSTKYKFSKLIKPLLFKW